MSTDSITQHIIQPGSEGLVMASPPPDNPSYQGSKQIISTIDKLNSHVDSWDHVLVVDTPATGALLLHEGPVMHHSGMGIEDSYSPFSEVKKDSPSPSSSLSDLGTPSSSGSIACDLAKESTPVLRNYPFNAPVVNEQGQRTLSTIKQEYESKGFPSYEILLKILTPAEMDMIIVGMMGFYSSNQHEPGLVPGKICIALHYQAPKLWEYVDPPFVIGLYCILKANQHDPKNPFRHWQTQWQDELRLEELKGQIEVLESDIRSLNERLGQPGCSRKLRASTVNDIHRKRTKIGKCQQKMSGKKFLWENEAFLRIMRDIGADHDKAVAQWREEQRGHLTKEER